MKTLLYTLNEVLNEVPTRNRSRGLSVTSQAEEDWNGYQGDGAKANQDGEQIRSSSGEHRHRQEKATPALVSRQICVRLNKFFISSTILFL